MTSSTVPVREGRRHIWIEGPTRAGRQRLLTGLGPFRFIAAVDAHRRLRGPYTAAGAMARALVPEALPRSAELVARHDVEVLTVAPELHTVVQNRRETLTSLAPPIERTRFYPQARTRRTAHGFTELVVALARRSGEVPAALLVENVDEADATDRELLAIMLRRSDPASLQLVLCGQLDKVSADLATALEANATCLKVVDSTGASGAEPPLPSSRTDLAARYVETDCTSDDRLLVDAYLDLPPEERRALHDARADALEAKGEVSLRLGAIPFHREHGSDPHGAGADALSGALEHCILMGFYDAVLELGARSFDLLDWQTDAERCWLVAAKVCTAFTAQGRGDEAMSLYDEACTKSTLPGIHMQAAYGRAMLYTRFYEPERRDHRRAKAWINTAIAIASLFPAERRRTFNVTFNENGLALIEMHLGDPNEALRLIGEGLRRLDADVDPEKEALHRSVLRYNRAQLLSGMGRLAEALQEYGELIELDPNHSEYYFDRAAVNRRAGRPDAAMADYEAAIRSGPPYAEAYYNRADLALEMGDLHAALADLHYVIELDPSFLDAYVNRASVLYQLGHLDAAEADVAIGLDLDPHQPHLHCLRGLVAQDRGRITEALAAFDTALRHDASLLAAWSNRGMLSFEKGDLQGALSDFSRALELEDDPVIRCNRAIAYQQVGRWQEAIADYTAALNDPDCDRDEILRNRALCNAHLGNLEPAGADLPE